MTIQILLDCGGYSARSRGKTIDLSSHIQFIRDNARWIGPYVALDVMPLSPTMPVMVV